MKFDRRTILMAILGLVTTVLAIIIAGAISDSAGGWLDGLGSKLPTALQDIKPELDWGGGAVTALCLLFIGLCLFGAWPELDDAGGPIPRERPVLKALRASLAPGTVRTSDPAAALEDLNRMVGLVPVKSEIRRLLVVLEIERRRSSGKRKASNFNLHMAFIGPPGVGKTEVARCLGQIYASTGLLKHGHVVEADRSTLVAGYVGQTAIKTLEVCKKALDGVLLIDEAHALAPQSGGSDGFGQEAINTLLKFMEDHRGRIAVVAAGYRSEMRRFLASNPGLSGRFSRQIEFPPYSQDELLEIFANLMTDSKFILPENWDRPVRPWLRDMMDREEWANARSMRNLADRVKEWQAERVAGIPGADLNQIQREDLVAAMESMG
jgi:stage V sporulation protein K